MDSNERKEVKKGIKNIYGDIKQIREVSLKKALKSLHELKKKLG